jgi:putative mRNA 3-end processing factor
MMERYPRFRNVLECTPKGLYCPAGDFYIDPWQAVERAVITHAHSDHARWGSKAYLSAETCRTLLKLRLGAGIHLETLPYGETKTIGSAHIALHPAGHILGSSQIRIEVDGAVAVVSGDYKRQADITCTPWEPVACHLLVTESTFGLPVFRWQSTERVIGEILQWWSKNQAAKRTSILLVYAVGKSQRLIAELCELAGRDVASAMYVHGALVGPNAAYRAAGVDLPEIPSAAAMPRGHDWSNSLIFAPPSAQNSPWLSRFKDPSVAMASGWMAIRGTRRRRAMDRGFVVSDHVDWLDLQTSINDCAPEQLWVTHGFAETLARYQTELGRPSRSIDTRFAGDDDEASQDGGLDPVADQPGEETPG